MDRYAAADHVFVTFEGAFVLARSMNDPGHMRAQLRVLRQLLEALLEPRPTEIGQGKTPQTIAITSL